MESRFELRVEPECGHWSDLLAQLPAGRMLGADLAEWRWRTRAELGLAADRPVVATGHQTLLWHPGILAKYFAVNAFAGDRSRHEVANLIVDQHTGDFGRFDAPIRRDDGTLAVRTLTLTAARPGVPMVDHPAFTPPAGFPGLTPALPSVASGIDAILAAVTAHREAANAARQMAAALDDLMAPWVDPMPGVGSSDLMGTSLARALLKAMVDDPRRCAAAYNAAVRSVPESGIPQLSPTSSGVELPLWRLGSDGRREHGDVSDARRCLGAHCACNEGACRLLPRALLLTALVRLGLCDLFVHGTGGANYDRAMERWIGDWLGVRPAPIAVATATLRLPLGEADATPGEVEAALHAARRAWHDPEGAAAAAAGAPSAAKRALLEAIDAAPRRSRERLDRFHRMHDELARLRTRHADRVAGARAEAEAARRRAAELPIAHRRDWPFPLYPREMLDALADEVCGERVSGAAGPA
jgi:hypothetical protein